MSVAKPSITATAVYKSLSQRKISYPYAWFCNHRISPTIRALKNLANMDPVKYQAYKGLIDFMIDIAKGEKVGVELTLHIPSLTALRAIDIEGLMQNAKARSAILKRCYNPTKGEIDLRPLVFINKNNTLGVYAPESSQS